MVEPTNVDGHKLIYHPKRVGEWNQKKDCYPIYVEIGLTNACNHKCVFCALDFLECGAEFIDSNILITNLKYMAENGLKSVMFAGEGEPLLHKGITPFIKKAKEFGLDISITTNGILFTKEKIEQCLQDLSWIRFSIDSGTSENYKEVHGTEEKDFKIVLENLKQAVAYKKENNLKTIIGTQFLVIPQNINQAVILAQKLKEIGVDNLQIKPYSHHPQSKNDFIINPEEYNKLKDKLMEFNSDDFKILFREATAQRIQEGIIYPECYGLPFFALIDAKGNIIPCNLFYDNPDFTYGNLNTQSFEQIWKSDKRKEVLKKIKEKGIAECRKGCRLDVINRYLHRIKNPNLHDNFI